VVDTFDGRKAESCPERGMLWLLLRRSKRLKGGTHARFPLFKFKVELTIKENHVFIRVQSTFLILKVTINHNFEKFYFSKLFFLGIDRGVLPP
jgi:hypothetical protein